MRIKKWHEKKFRVPSLSIFLLSELFQKQGLWPCFLICSQAAWFNLNEIVNYCKCPGNMMEKRFGKDHPGNMDLNGRNCRCKSKIVLYNLSVTEGIIYNLLWICCVPGIGLSFLCLVLLFTIILEGGSYYLRFQMRGVEGLNNLLRVGK